MLFHYSFCSLYKKEFAIEPVLLRYLNLNMNSQSEHFYIQFQEQKRRKLYKSGTLTEPNRLILTNKSIQKIIDLCNRNEYEQIVVELTTGTKEEILLLKKLNDTKLPISIFVSDVENNLLNSIDNLNIKSIFQLTDIFNLKVRL